jgi:hypothetical protein
MFETHGWLCYMRRFFALDASRPILRRGPTSRLPAAENQIVIWNYQTGVQHSIFIDTTSGLSPWRLINCTRAKTAVEVGAT